jgi:molybdopterin-binding protein
MRSPSAFQDPEGHQIAKPAQAIGHPSLAVLIASKPPHDGGETPATPHMCQGAYTMKLSARNQIAGTIKTVKPGATTTHVTIEISADVTITASITNEAAEELELKPGMKAFAVVKASDVMVGV